MADLYFNGSIWCNVDIALRAVSSLFKQEAETLGLTVIEWYIMRVLYEQDGQVVGQLAHAVGRPPTSFTPIIDAIERKGFIKRIHHPSDRRVVQIYMTDQGKLFEGKITESANRLENKIRQLFSDDDWQAYEQVVEIFQHLKVSEVLSTT